MANICIAASTKMALQRRACDFGRYVSTGERMKDGTWLVPLDDYVFDRLKKAALDGETIDDTIQRLIRLTDGTPLN
jgi:hypothetical protein